MSDKIICCKPTEIQGNIAFGQGCIIHPGCSIIAEGGDIIFGDYNIIEERVKIVNRGKIDVNGQLQNSTMYIGSFNLFEVGATIDSSEIGDLNVFEHKSNVGFGCSIQKGSIVSAGVYVKEGSKLSSNKIILDYNVQRPNLNPNDEALKLNMIGLSEVLAKCLPTYNQLRKISG